MSLTHQTNENTAHAGGLPATRHALALSLTDQWDNPPELNERSLALLEWESRMKERLLASSFAYRLLAVRQWLALNSLPLRNPEKASLVANSIIADRLIARICNPNGNFLDIGAHIGSVVASVRKHSHGVRIFGVEADLVKFASLKARFADCHFFPYAVGEAAGEAIFYSFPNRSGYNSLAVNDTSDAVKTKVEVRTLDGLFPALTFDVIKLDVEGAELGALRGGSVMIARSRPTIMFESTGTSENALGYAPVDLLKWFKINDFDIFLPDRLAHDSPPMDEATFLDAHYYPMRSVNFFAVPTERRTELRDKARRILGVGRG